MFGRTWGESKSLSLEGRIPDGVAAELQRRGQPVAMATMSTTRWVTRL